MSVHSKIIISILVPVIVLLLLACFFYFFIKLLHKKFYKYYDELKIFLDHEPYNEGKTILATADTNLKKLESNRRAQLKKYINDEKIDNQSFENDTTLKEINRDMIEFADCLNNINKNISKLKRLREDGCKSLEKKQYFLVWKNILEIKKIKFETNNIQDFVNKKSSDYVDEVQEMSKQNYQLQQECKRIDEIIDMWVNNGVDEQFKQILIQKKEELKSLQERFFDQISESKIDNKFRSDFFQYQKMLYQFLVFANHFDAFYDVIFIDIPKKINFLKNYINSVKERVENDLAYLDIDNYFLNIENQYDEIKKRFYMFDIVDLENNINHLFQMFADLNTIVNNESLAFNFLNEKGLPKFIKESYNQLIENFILIKGKIEDALSIDKYFFNWLNDDLNNLEEMMQKVEELYKFIESNKNNQSIPSMTKQFKIKSFIYTIKSFKEKYYETSKNINAFYAQGKSPRIKFFKMKQLFLSFNVQLHEKNIKLSLDENKFIDKIENKRNHVDELIVSNQEGIEENINNEVNEFQDLFAIYLNTICKKLIYSKLFNYISSEFSYLILNNEHISNAFKKSRHEYSNGNYENSIKIVVQAINKGVN